MPTKQNNNDDFDLVIPEDDLNIPDLVGKKALHAKDEDIDQKRDISDLRLVLFYIKECVKFKSDE